MKIFWIFVLTIIAVFVSANTYVSPVLEAGTTCFNRAVESQNRLISQLETFQSDEGKKTFYCEENAIIFEDLRDCFRQVKTTNVIAPLFIQLFPKFHGTMVDSMQTHNRSCLLHQVKYP